MFWSIVSAALLILLCRWWLRNRKFYELAAKLEKPPGLSSHPLFGHAAHFNNPKQLLELCKSFKAPCSVAYMGAEPIFFLNDANMVEQVLTNSQCLNKPHFVDNLHHVKNAVFVARDDAWHRYRKIIFPIFQARMVHYYESISAHREMLVRQLSAKTDGDVDIFAVFQKYIFMHFFECMLGIDISDWFEKYSFLAQALLHRANLRWNSLFPKMLYWLNAINERKETATLHRYVIEIIDKRRAIINNKAQEDNEKTEGLILLDYMLDCFDQGKLSYQELVEEIVTLIQAGTDTTVYSLSAITVLLAMNPEIQEKAYQEICQVLQGKPFDPSDYSRLPYLQMVMKETLRMCTISATVPRLPKEDIKIGDYTFPKNSTLHMNIVNMHYNPKYFDKPDVFMPERFATEEEKTRPRYAWMPFSGGKRQCPGEYLSRQMIVGTIATLLQNYRLECKYKSLDDVRMVLNFVIIFEAGYNVQIYPRK